MAGENIDLYVSTINPFPTSIERHFRLPRAAPKEWVSNVNVAMNPNTWMGAFYRLFEIRFFAPVYSTS